MPKETTIAKLRNALTPSYSLAQLVLKINEHPDMKRICIKTAKQTIAKQKKIHKLLLKIEREQKELEKTSFTKIIIKDGRKTTGNNCTGRGTDRYKTITNIKGYSNNAKRG